ncbi:hypothetical protein BRL83_21500 [Xanthomonas oryzae pv. oryzae]|nr:hypothetical protein BRM96_06225 [Xanthomonas oryzae pv. oryzae]RBI13607.1 hypothetical protein BRL87_22360 [Xanthomonas oryzae pv. oryzae]RBI25382.1 hypothetical protein BRL83_21500 [Xanthomonas oryzae pv. oryzae]RBI41069.1 hypothetical protein BRL69_08550 [Xanthomonas oryzae pv. oryzae]RBI57582.1 hypothetical protein BRL99_00605 [Xanthomonas oryzae pv. oryzae]
MAAIRVFDTAARNLMRCADADCVAPTRVREITDSPCHGSAEQENITLIPQDFFRHRYAATQQAQTANTTLNSLGSPPPRNH